MLVAWFFIAPLAIIGGFFFHYGIGKDIWYFPLEHLRSFFLLIYIEGFCYALATGFVKIVLLAFYLKVFPNQVFRRATWAMIWLITSWTTGLTLVALFQCKPVSFAWQRWDLQHNGRCINYSAFVLTQAALNLLFDLIILVMPMPTLYRLNTNTRKKIQIMVMFSLGFVIVVVSTLRIRALTFALDTQNPSYTACGPILWSNIEVYVSIICACLPATKRFLQNLLSPWLGPKVDGWTRKASRSIRRGGPASDCKILKRISFSLSSPQNSLGNDAVQLAPWETAADRSQCSGKLTMTSTKGGTGQTAWQQGLENTIVSTAHEGLDQV